MVFRNVRAGLAWNLAGGYQTGKTDDVSADPVIQLHWNTLHESDDSLSIRKSWNSQPLEKDAE
jgi:hypothetical protein